MGNFLVAAYMVAASRVGAWLLLLVSVLALAASVAFSGASIGLLKIAALVAVLLSLKRLRRGSTNQIGSEL
jgi:Na+/proline symporter